MRFNIKKSKEHPYWHIGLGVWITSESHLRREMKKQGCVEVGTQDIRQKKHRGMSARDIKEMYHPGSTNGESVKKYYTVKGDVR